MTTPSKISAHCKNLMKREESYSERRLLFKNIWETAMQINDKDADIMNKPKVIKTLRLDEVDRCVIGKKKKERLRNLRTVCNKILDFCDRQDADDKFYEQVAEGHNPPQYKLELKTKKIKRHRGRRKVKKVKSAFAPKTTIVNQAKATTSERKDDYLFIDRTRSPSPNKMKRTVVRRTLTRHRSTKLKSSSNNADANKSPGKASVTRRKIVCRKRRSKLKKVSIPEVSPPRPSGVNNVRYVTTPLKGRTVAKRLRELLLQ